MKTEKKGPFKWNLLGLIKIEDEDLSFGQKIWLYIISLTFLLVLVVLLKVYLLPLLGVIKPIAWGLSKMNGMIKPP